MVAVAPAEKIFVLPATAHAAADLVAGGDFTALGAVGAGGPYGFVEEIVKIDLAAFEGGGVGVGQIVRCVVQQGLLGGQAGRAGVESLNHDFGYPSLSGSARRTYIRFSD